MLSPDEIQERIDTLLCFMNDDLETQGMMAKSAIFNFLSWGDDYINFISIHRWDEQLVEKVLKICVARGLLEDKSGMGGNFGELLRLTEEGQSRAISVKHGKKRMYELGSGMQIESLVINGPGQVGNGNIQNIQSAIASLQQQIDTASASKAEKDEAKGLLAKFLEHPLVCSIIGGVTGALPG